MEGISAPDDGQHPRGKEGWVAGGGVSFRGSLGCAVTAPPGLLLTLGWLPELRARTGVGGSMEDRRGKLALRGRGRRPKGRDLVELPRTHSLLEYVPRAKLRSGTPASARSPPGVVVAG